MTHQINQDSLEHYFEYMNFHGVFTSIKQRGALKSLENVIGKGSIGP